MEDDLKILKVEYLSNHSLDPPQILNLSSRDQTRKLEETSEEISSVALLSPACFQYFQNASMCSKSIYESELMEKEETSIQFILM